MQAKTGCGKARVSPGGDSCVAGLLRRRYRAAATTSVRKGGGAMMMGKILRVNLSTRQIKEEPYPEALSRRFMGGAAAAIKILYDEVDPTVDALGPDNKLIASLGFLAGTAAPVTSRVA